MYEIRISDGLFEQVSQAALAQSVSVDEFIVEAVRLHLRDDEESERTFFTPARVEEIREAAAEARTGKNISLEQYKEAAKLRSAKWQANQNA
jgi:predicted HicB family RNase H-like nuclease